MFVRTHKKLVCLRTSKAVILNRDRTLCSNNDGKKYLVKHGGRGGSTKLKHFYYMLGETKTKSNIARRFPPKPRNDRFVPYQTP